VDLPFRSQSFGTRCTVKANLRLRKRLTQYSIQLPQRNSGTRYNALPLIAPNEVRVVCRFRLVAMWEHEHAMLPKPQRRDPRMPAPSAGCKRLSKSARTEAGKFDPLEMGGRRWPLARSYECLSDYDFTKPAADASCTRNCAPQLAGLSSKIVIRP
jgi:hypothetical protein